MAGHISVLDQGCDYREWPATSLYWIKGVITDNGRPHLCTGPREWLPEMAGHISVLDKERLQGMAGHISVLDQGSDYGEWLAKSRYWTKGENKGNGWPHVCTVQREWLQGMAWHISVLDQGSDYMEWLAISLYWTKVKTQWQYGTHIITLWYSTVSWAEVKLCYPCLLLF